jgi:hypothetical protein
MSRPPHALLIAAALAMLLPACRITDHSEVDAGDIRFPVSGYQEAGTKDHPRMDFERTRIDLGPVVQGARVTELFHFTNTGRSALVITDVRGSCGCTVGKSWPKQPVPPGGTGTIEVTFDSEGRTGHQDNSVTVLANTAPPTTVLAVTAEVVGPGGLQPEQ